MRGRIKSFYHNRNSYTCFYSYEADRSDMERNPNNFLYFLLTHNTYYTILQSLVRHDLHYSSQDDSNMQHTKVRSTMEIHYEVYT